MSSARFFFTNLKMLLSKKKAPWDSASQLAIDSVVLYSVICKREVICRPIPLSPLEIFLRAVQLPAPELAAICSQHLFDTHGTAFWTLKCCYILVQWYWFQIHWLQSTIICIVYKLLPWKSNSYFNIAAKQMVKEKCCTYEMGLLKLKRTEYTTQIKRFW